MNQKSILRYLPLLLLLALAVGGCSKLNHKQATMLFSNGCYPYAVFHEGKYYFLKQEPSDAIILRVADDLKKVAEAREITILKSTAQMQHVWSPELHRINGRWYIYFEADDGNTDNHQLYVLENANGDPAQGNWTLHGPILTNAEWNFGIHPSSIVVKGKQYLFWSGWPKRRNEEETQCIYMARMANPWTLATERLMISAPTEEWERQWIDPDGHRSAYPIYVNENPEPVLSKDGRHLIIYYSASGCWTVYNCVGMVSASVDSDVMNPRSWTKHPEPVFAAVPQDSIFGPADICIPAGQPKPQLLYETKHLGPTGTTKDIRLKAITYDAKGFPVLGRPY